MAYLDSANDKLQTDQSQQNLQGQVTQQAQGTGSPAPTVGTTGSFVGGNNAPTPQNGSGGSQGFTNIQNYLLANQGDSSGQSVLAQNATNTYNNEVGAAKTASDTSKSAADSEQKYTLGQDDASKLISQAGNTGTYTNGQYNAGTTAPGATAATTTDPYGAIKQQLQDSYSRQYQGPANFTYGTGADAQKAINGFSGTNKDFYNYLNGIYAQNGPSTIGVNALQNQFDVSSQGLQNERASQAAKYSALPGALDQQVKDTNQYLKDSADKYKTSEDSQKSYLNNQATQNQSAVNKAVTDWNANVNTTDASAQAAKDQYNKLSFDYSRQFQPGDNPDYKTEYDKANAIKGNGNTSLPLVHADVSTGGLYDTQAGNIDPSKPNAWNTVNWSDLVQSTPGQKATTANVAGVDDQRNRYNAITDALGLTNFIGQDSSHPNGSQLNDTQAAYNQRLASLDAQMGAKGFKRG